MGTVCAVDFTAGWAPNFKLAAPPAYFVPPPRIDFAPPAPGPSGCGPGKRSRIFPFPPDRVEGIPLDRVPKCFCAGRKKSNFPW